MLEELVKDFERWFEGEIDAETFKNRVIAMRWLAMFISTGIRQTEGAAIKYREAHVG
jgi:hypothetical protein